MTTHIAPHTERVGTPTYDAAADRSAQVAGQLQVVADWPEALMPGAGKGAAVLQYAAGLRVIADQLDPPD